MTEKEIDGAAGLSVYGARAVPGTAEVLAQLLSDGVPGLLAAKDPTLWGPEAEAESKIRLGWVDTFRRSRALLPQLEEIRASLREKGLDHVVLSGMGGSSLAPEVITRTLDVPLTVLDTTDPHQVSAALGDRLSRTVVVVASKSGSTVETDSHRRAYLDAFERAGLDDIGGRFVIVTDPGSPFEQTAREMGAHVVLADPEVGGRYSALTAFGLVPSALAGVNVAELLDQADELAATIGNTDGNPTLVLGAALGAAALAGRDKVALVPDGSGIVGLGDWAEQLIAESSGKDGKGILPVVVETPASPGATGADVLTVTVGGALTSGSVPGGGVDPDVSVNGPLGAHFLAWEVATAIACRVIGVNPFDQPNVAESKANTNRILENGAPPATPSFVDGAIEVYADGLAEGLSTVGDAVRALLAAAPEKGYVAVMAYLDRNADADTALLRAALARETDRAVTFGWGPRFLHSTGQYHKGGPAVGAFLQITGAVVEDLPVKGKPYTFGELIGAQAAGDREAIAGRGRPLLHLHLTDRAAGVRQLLAAFSGGS
ncbi:glucose-6-phosphate isomerase [Virgisporangium aliadipatigenens]|uniref:Glucose-6-phosphate isomerase n=1 Tax=Virgisporangium aliadipatigenens TaxID=741659 RepID=A0A8J3YN67_9ACTN|nr:glucose-6-phosphate isomerase [Virgisporangium aliadipatigenens]GIJ47422.1 glucose-6-phosphate isomerase [Virgisporangium aliadipatigenens]